MSDYFYTYENNLVIKCGDAICTIKNQDGKIHVEGDLTEGAQVFFDKVCQLWNTPTSPWMPIESEQTDLPSEAKEILHNNRWKLYRESQPLKD